MKKIGLIAFILTHLFLHGQNLVNNPSFETISTCGTQATLAVNWKNPTQAGTPDLYNTCSPNWVPAHSGGLFYQWPRTGNSYIGIWAYSKSITNGREYLQTQLSSQLIANNYYLVSFYTNLVNWARYSVNNIGIYISNTQISLTGSTNYLLNYSPQIKKFNNPIITDTLNWIEVSAIYQANGTENYITIGNFNNDVTTDTLLFNSSIYTDGAYYLIDDVSLTNITTPKWQYRDTTVYLGDSVLIGPAITGLNINWYTMNSAFIKNAPGIYVKPTVNTSYKATESFNSAVYNHTVTVRVLAPLKVTEYDKLQNSVKIFPNPSKGSLALSLSCFDKLNNQVETICSSCKITITDVLGKEVLNEPFKKEIDISNLETGIYFLHLYHQGQLVVTKKIIKE